MRGIGGIIQYTVDASLQRSFCLCVISLSDGSEEYPQAPVFILQHKGY
jgi:hypothetical protein